MSSEHAQAEFANVNIGDGALVPDDLLENLKRFKPIDLPRPPTLVMPTYAQEDMPWPARKWVYDDNNKYTHSVSIHPNWKDYKQCCDNLREYSYMQLYNKELPLYKENLRFKTATPQFCHALQDVLNEKYARHLQMTVLYEKREELLIAQAHRKAAERDEFVDDDEIMADVKAEVAKHGESNQPNDPTTVDTNQIGPDDNVENLFGSDDEDEPSKWKTDFDVDEVEQYDEDDFYKGA